MMNVRKALGRTAAAVATILGSGALYIACSSCCIRAGSLVLTPDGEVPIESLEVGDVVLSWDFRSQRLVENRVEATYRKVGLTWVEAVLPGGARLEATHDHEAYDAASGGYVEVGQVARFAHLDDQGALAIDAAAQRESRYGLATFHDLTLGSEPRNYVANGVVVHNKTISPYGAISSSGPIGDIITADGSSGGANPDIVSPIGAIAGGGPVGDILTADDFSGTNPDIVSPYGSSAGGPIGGITGGGGASVGGGTGGGGTPPAGSGNLALGAPIPSTGSRSGGEVILMRGTGVETGISVTIGGVQATVLGTGASGTPGTGVDMIAVQTPPGTGSRDIVITTPDGDTQTQPGAFTYLATDVPRFRAGTDKWYVLTTGGPGAPLGDGDNSGASDVDEALQAAIGPSGAAGDFTGQGQAFTIQLLGFVNQFYRNNVDGSPSFGGLQISFMSDRDDGGALLGFANGELSPTPGNFLVPNFPGDYNVIALRHVAEPHGTSGVVGQAIGEGENTNPAIDSNTFFIRQEQMNGNELGIYTNAHIMFWNSSAIAPTQRTLIELAQEFAATLAHEVGHSIGREHTDDAPAAPGDVNIMSATSTFDVDNVYAFDEARFQTMLGYMPGPNRRVHAVAYAPKSLVRDADAVVIGTPERLQDGTLTVRWHETLYGSVNAPGGELGIRGFDRTASAGPPALQPLGRVMFFLELHEGQLWLRDSNDTVGLDSPSGAELDLTMRDYLAIEQLSGAARQKAYRERVATSLSSRVGFLRTATLVELSLDKATCRALSQAQFAPVQGLVADGNARLADRILAGQLMLHRADPAYAADVLNAALATDDPKLLKTLAGVLEVTHGLTTAASKVRDRLVSLDAAQVARARVLLGWLQDASAVELIGDALGDDAQASAAADGLGRIGNEAALPALQAVAVDDTRSQRIRHHALRAIGRIGGDAARAWLTARHDALPAGEARDAVRFARDYPWTWLLD